MKPIKPKYTDTVPVRWAISKRSKEIINQYSKYTGYDESELIDIIISDIMDDSSFVKWLSGRRYKTKIDKLIFQRNLYTEDENNETNEETGYF